MKKEWKNEEEKIAYNCRHATFLIEKKQSEPLTAREIMELQLHLAGCYICRVYEQQSVLINNMVRNLLRNPEKTGIRLDDDFKNDLKKKINEHLHE